MPLKGLDNTEGQGQILNFLVNASHPKPFDVATSNFVADQVT